MSLSFCMIRTAGAAVLALVLLFAGPVPAPAQMFINEVVTDPQLDWEDEGGGDGVAFNQFPGTGTVTVSDEWIEIFNLSTQTIDFTSWTLEMIDASPATEAFTSGSPTLYFPFFASFTNFVPGARLIVGNPAGDMDSDVYLVLRDDTGAVVDAVELGTGDFAGDGPFNNAPSGAARGIDDEAVARIPDGTDTGQPQFDFQRTQATIALRNPRAQVPPVFLINEIVTDPQQDWDDSQGGNGTPFDDQPGSGAVTDADQWIELVNVSPAPGSILYWTLVMHDTAPATETLTGDGPTTFVFENSGRLDSVLPGEHVVIGNPAGAMDDVVWIRLLDRQGRVVDEVELGDRDYRGNGPGDEAPDGQASGTFYEAVARLPDGTRTGTDAAHFSRQRATILGPNGSTFVQFWHLYR